MSEYVMFLTNKHICELLRQCYITVRQRRHHETIGFVEIVNGNPQYFWVVPSPWDALYQYNIYDITMVYGRKFV